MFHKAKEMLMTKSTKRRRYFGLKHSARDPQRMMNIADFWAEFDHPIEHLDDPQRTILGDAKHLVGVCLVRDIHFQVPDTGLSEALFPVWVLEKKYPHLT